MLPQEIPIHSLRAFTPFEFRSFSTYFPKDVGLQIDPISHLLIQEASFFEG